MNEHGFHVLGMIYFFGIVFSYIGVRKPLYNNSEGLCVNPEGKHAAIWPRRILLPSCGLYKELTGLAAASILAATRAALARWGMPLVLVLVPLASLHFALHAQPLQLERKVGDVVAKFTLIPALKKARTVEAFCRMASGDCLCDTIW